MSSAVKTAKESSLTRKMRNQLIMSDSKKMRSFKEMKDASNFSRANTTAHETIFEEPMLPTNKYAEEFKTEEDEEPRIAPK